MPGARRPAAISRAPGATKGARTAEDRDRLEPPRQHRRSGARRRRQLVNPCDRLVSLEGAGPGVRGRREVVATAARARPPHRARQRRRPLLPRPAPLLRQRDPARDARRRCAPAARTLGGHLPRRRAHPRPIRPAPRPPLPPQPGSVGVAYRHDPPEGVFRADPSAGDALLMVADFSVALGFRRGPVDVDALAEAYHGKDRPFAEGVAARCAPCARGPVRRGPPVAGMAARPGTPRHLS